MTQIPRDQFDFLSLVSAAVRMPCFVALLSYIILQCVLGIPRKKIFILSQHNGSSASQSDGYVAADRFKLHLHPWSARQQW